MHWAKASIKVLLQRSHVCSPACTKAKEILKSVVQVSVQIARVPSAPTAHCSAWGRQVCVKSQVVTRSPYGAKVVDRQEIHIGSMKVVFVGSGEVLGSHRKPTQ
jgi:hypothetical protein